MRLILCTLAVCISILASAFTTKKLILEEGKKIRVSIPKTQSEPPEAAGRQEPLVQKLEVINVQLANINRRMTLLEDTIARQPQSTAPDKTAEELQALTRNVEGLTGTLAGIGAMPRHLAELTTYFDRSFAHLESKVAESAAPALLAESLDGLSKKVDQVDSYFPALYAFFGVLYDPANADMYATYPSVDKRINELFIQLDTLQADVTYIKNRLTYRTYERPKYQP